MSCTETMHFHAKIYCKILVPPSWYSILEAETPGSSELFVTTCDIIWYKFTYLLTPWSRVLLEKLTGSAASQEIPPHFWNPKVPHRTRKCPPPVLILSQLHPVPTTPSHFLKIHLNIILPSTSGSPQWSLSLRFPNQNPVHTSSLPHTRHMPRPSHYHIS